MPLYPWWKEKYELLIFLEVDEAVAEVGENSTAKHEPKTAPTGQLNSESIEQMLGSAV